LPQTFSYPYEFVWSLLHIIHSHLNSHCIYFANAKWIHTVKTESRYYISFSAPFHKWLVFILRLFGTQIEQASVLHHTWFMQNFAAYNTQCVIAAYEFCCVVSNQMTTRKFDLYWLLYTTESFTNSFFAFISSQLSSLQLSVVSDAFPLWMVKLNTEDRVKIPYFFSPQRSVELSDLYLYWDY
jgi:hypothetical protein